MTSARSRGSMVSDIPDRRHKYSQLDRRVTMLQSTDRHYRDNNLLQPPWGLHIRYFLQLTNLTGKRSDTTITTHCAPYVKASNPWKSGILLLASMVGTRAMANDAVVCCSQTLEDINTCNTVAVSMDLFCIVDQLLHILGSASQSHFNDITNRYHHKLKLHSIFDPHCLQASKASPQHLNNKQIPDMTLTYSVHATTRSTGLHQPITPHTSIQSSTLQCAHT